jgi:hypothetical protein
MGALAIRVSGRYIRGCLAKDPGLISFRRLLYKNLVVDKISVQKFFCLIPVRP